METVRLLIKSIANNKLEQVLQKRWLMISQYAYYLPKVLVYVQSMNGIK